MKQRAFLLLLSASLAAAVLAWWAANQIRPQDRAGSAELLFPGLAEKINQVQKITITGAGDKNLVTIERGETAWVVTERAGYPADWDKVRRLLVDFAEATIVEPKTAQVARYSQLGVEDVAAEDAGGVLVTLGDPAAKESGPRLIIGKANNAGTGRYVRRLGETQSYAASGLFEAPRAVTDWLQKEVLDIAADRIDEVFIRHAGGEVVHAKRKADDKSNFELVNLPADRELSSQWAVNALPNSLVKVLIDDVKPRSADLEFTPDVTLLFVTGKGLNIELALDKNDDEHWLAIDANAEPPAPAASGDGKSSADKAGASATDTAAEKSAAQTAGETVQAKTDDVEADENATENAESVPDPANEAAMLKARHQAWYYKIPEYKYNAWAKHLEDLLKPLADEKK